MKVQRVVFICAALFALQADAQNVSIDLQNPPNSVPGCHVFSQFAIGETTLCACIKTTVVITTVPHGIAVAMRHAVIPVVERPSHDLPHAGNYSGPLLCSTPGQQSVPGAPPCVVSRTPRRAFRLSRKQEPEYS